VTFSNSQQYYFSDRGEFRLDDINSTDLALNYRLPISRFEIFAQGELINIFDRKTVRVVSTAIQTRNNSNDARLTTFNPFTDTPVQCTASSAPGSCHYILPAAFGTPTSATASTPGNAFTSNYQVARTYRFSLGFRF
jgi:hypothetical protein